MNQKRQRCKEALKFINNGKLSEKNSDCTQQPFFLQSKHIEPDIGFNTPLVNNILDEVQLPDKIKTIYQVIGETNVEHYTQNWVLMSLDKIKNFHDDYIKNGQHRANDFALTYAGMGHVLVCSYDPDTDKIYYRMSGGANEYERLDYRKEALEYIPKDEHLHDIQHFFNTVKEGTEVFSIPRIN